MAWRSEVIGKRKDKTNGNILIDVAYTGPDGQTANQTLPANTITDAQIADHCQRFCTMMEARDAAFDAITIGQVALPRDTMTDDEKAAAEAAAAHTSALRDLQGKANTVASMKMLVDAGVVADTDPLYVSAKDDAAAAVAAFADAKVAVEAVVIAKG